MYSLIKTVLQHSIIKQIQITYRQLKAPKNHNQKFCNQMHFASLQCVRLSQGRLPDPTWKRRPGRPRGIWIDQLRRDNNRPPADQWKLAIKRGHGGRATLQSHDYATT